MVFAFQPFNSQQVTIESVILDELPLPLYFLDEDLNLIFANQAALDFFTLERDHLPTPVNAYLSYSEQVRFRQALEVVRSQKKWEGEVVYGSEEHPLGVVDSKWFLIPGFDFFCVGVVNTNASERKVLQDHIIRLQRLDSVGHITSGVLHDLNNIFSVFVMSAKALRPQVQPGRSSTILDMMEKGVHRGVNLLSHMMNFARGKENVMGAVEIKPILTELRDLMKKSMSRHVRFEIELSPKLWKIHGNIVQIHQILLNLCSNAKDALPEEGGIIKVYGENLTLTENMVGDYGELGIGEYVCIRVMDSGGGIPEDVQEKIFEPFYTTKESGKGTGLGLYTVKHIVKSHGGYIGVNSVMGQGTEFVLVFPASPV